MDDDFETNSVVPLLLCLFVVPIVGWLVAAGLAIGDEATTINQLAIGAIAVGGIALSVLVLSPRIAGRNRARVVATFGPGIRIVLICLAVSVVLQAILFVYSLFILEASLIGRVHGGLMLVIGIGALLASLSLIGSSLTILKVPPLVVRGEVLPRESSFHAHVSRIADSLLARAPDNIVVGLDPTFYVTAAPVRVVGSDADLQGTTLYASVPLMRLLSSSEFDAVIGHELGHFKGEDVEYSLRFAPLYSRLGAALAAMSDHAGNASDLGKVPAQLVLSSYIERFARVERTIGRDRELAADQAGAEVSTPEALATALLKVAIFSGNWDWLTREHISSLGEGRTFTQLASSFAGICEIDSNADWDAILGAVSGAAQSHPIDTHPTFSERLAALKYPISDLAPAHCALPEVPATQLIEDADDVDRRLSILEAQWLLAIGAASLPATYDEDASQAG